MRLQFDGERVRLRVGHADLAMLREGGIASVALAWPGIEWRAEVRVGSDLSLQIADAVVQLTLPRTDIEALAARLPSRDGLRYRIDLSSGPLDLRFEVDLHDGRARPR